MVEVKIFIDGVEKLSDFCESVDIMRDVGKRPVECEGFVTQEPSKNTTVLIKGLKELV